MSGGRTVSAWPRVFLPAALLLLAVDARSETARPRYVFFNQAPGIVWNQAKPESFTREGFDDVVRTLNAPENPSLRIGVSFMFSILEDDVSVLSGSLRALLRVSEESRVPVLVIFDGQQWWESRSDLWNWWDPERPGYRPDNADNVEWTGWDKSKAVKVGWRNWGSQIRVAPAPNIASPRFLRANLERIRVLALIVAEWFLALPEDRKWLFGGVKVGNEAGTGYNAFFYPDGNRYVEQWPGDASHDPQYGLALEKGLAGGVAPIGYAAVKTAGIKESGEITNDDLGRVTGRYLAELAKAVREAGVPRERISSHQGGTYPPWGTHVSFDAAFNSDSIPGWSFYGLDPAQCGNLGSLLDQRPCSEWAAAEWWWGGSTKEEWLDHFRRTLTFRNCRYVAVYNWDCGFSFKHEQAGHEAVRELVGTWNDQVPIDAGDPRNSSLQKTGS